MAAEKYILVRLFCEQTQIEVEFVRNLQEYGLVNFEEREDDVFMDKNDIIEIERLFRLHNDLGINYEGLGVISQMLSRIQGMEEEMNFLQKKLRLYE